ERLAAELEVREFLARYTSAFDAGDLDAVTACFTENALLVTERGSFEGRDRIAAQYGVLIAGRTGGLHKVLNDVVRVSPETQDAWLIAYFHGLRLGPGEQDA